MWMVAILNIKIPELETSRFEHLDQTFYLPGNHYPRGNFVRIHLRIVVNTTVCPPAKCIRTLWMFSYIPALRYSHFEHVLKSYSAYFEYLCSHPNQLRKKVCVCIFSEEITKKRKRKRKHFYPM